jgi:RNA polymerase sigma-70 factor (sigma-E family)
MGWSSARDQEFGDYYVSRVSAMRSTAYLLCGDWHLAEDLCQVAFTKLYLAWSRVARRESLDPYVRRIVLRTYLDDRRRPWRRERPIEPATTPDATAAGTDSDQRLALLAALRRLPARQRATLVLRYWEDQSVEECAELLGVSTGTVKSQSARGLDNLRALIGDSLPDIAAVLISA